MIRPLLPAALVLFWTTTAAAAPAVDPALLAGMKARSIGPAGMSGRIGDVEGLASDPNVFYVGAATGGLWKSEDGGFTFRPIFDDQPVAAVGAVAVNQRYPDIVWVGTGEGAIRNSVSVGNGVYKSVDGGKTWTHLGLDQSERIDRIVLHPDDPLVAYVAATGKLWGDSEERGVFKTVDGGVTWQKILYVNERTGCADLVMDPVNPDKLFAAMYEFRRTPGYFESGGWGSGLYVTRDGGATWKQLTEDDGLPKGKLGRIGLAIAPSDPDIVYALVEAKDNAFLRSHDGGMTWSKTKAERMFGNRPFYYSNLRVDPQFPNRVYSLWSMVSVSDDGGDSFRVLVPYNEIHPDHHAMWINPGDGRTIIEGNDGGVGISRDRGETWRFVSNLPLAQFYHIKVDMDVPYHVYGGMQDNGSWRGPSQVWENGGIRNQHWEEIGFGDGFDASPDPKDSMQGYSMSQEGYLMRWDLRTGERKAIRPASAPGDSLRFNWNAGFAQDPGNAETIYFGSQYLHKSTDRGETWTIISPDLTSDNPEWQKAPESGGLTPDATGAENFTTVIAIAPSPVRQGVIWVGTDDGRVHVTRNGGGAWASLEDKASKVPPGTWVPHIGASPHDPGAAFVVFDNHRRSDWTPYVFRVTDYGNRWESLATPDIRGYCLTIEQDPVDPNLLFLGTEFGLFVSLDAGKSWMKWTHGVPTCSVMDLTVHPRESDLVLGTHGRAAFVLDDIRPLRTLSADVMAEKIHLFDPPPAQQYMVKQTGASRFPGATEYRGENRPYGALITFALHDDNLPHPDKEVERARQEKKRLEARGKEGAGEKEKGKEKPEGRGGRGRGGDKGPTATVEIKDPSGKVLRKLTPEVYQGVNRVVWSLDTKRFRSPRGGGFFDDEGEAGGGGPEVIPGTYDVVVTYDKAVATGKITVLADPRFEISMDDREAAWDALQREGRRRELLADAVQRMQDTRKDLDYVIAKVGEIQREAKKGPGDDEGEGEGEGEGGDESAAAPDTSSADPLNALKKDAGELEKKLDGFDHRIRRDRSAKGIPGGTTLMGELGDAQWFLGSTWHRPSPTVIAYLDKAEASLQDFLKDLNYFYSTDVLRFKKRADEANLGLLAPKQPLEMGN